jgi:iron complex outermembrane receptor protein
MQTKSNFLIISRSGLTVLALVSVLCPFATSAQVLEEIVVTAQKREQNIQDVGIAITAFSGNQMSQLGISDPSDLDTQVPGLMVTDFGNNYTSVYTLRGSSQLDFADHHEPPVAVYIDGAYNSFLGAVGQSFYDLERIEVLKGPQGTLFGRNATGGVMQMATAKPTREFEGFAEAEGGENGLLRFEGAVSGPLSETISGRLSMFYKTHNGYLDDPDNGVGLDGSNLIEVESRNLRGQLLFEPSEEVSLLVQARWNDENDSNTSPYHARAAASHFPETNGAALFAFTGGVTGLLGIPNDPNFIIPAVGNGDGLVHEEIAGTVNHVDGCNHPQSVGFHSGTGAVDCFGTITDDGDPFTADVNTAGSYDRQYWAITGTLNWDVGGFEIVNILDYQSLNKFYVEDTDGGPAETIHFDQFVDSWQLSLAAL